MNTTTNVANEILRQLGGNRFATMTGAKNLVAIENGLTLKLGRNASGITHLTVTLDPSDTYTVRFQRVHGRKITEKGTHEGIYCDMLVPLFEKETGLATSL